MKLFATRVWGMGFERIPIATFGMKGHVDRLLRLAQRGDRVVFVGTQTERTDEENRGKILGMAEVGFEPLKTLDLIDRADLDQRDFDASGNFKFPHAVALTRAWRFEPALCSCGRSQNSWLWWQPRACRRSQILPTSLQSWPSSNRDRPAEPTGSGGNASDERRPPQHHRPRPSSGGYEVNPPSDTKALTYGLRFGKRDVWKIGWSTDVDARCADINQHIPVELGLEKWGVVLTQSMETHDAAYDMEQRVLELLASKRKGFERVHCTREEVESAWQRAFVDIIRRI